MTHVDLAAPRVIRAVACGERLQRLGNLFDDSPLGMTATTANPHWSRHLPATVPGRVQPVTKGSFAAARQRRPETAARAS